MNNNSNNNKNCPECNRSRIYEYYDMEWTIWICWRCGHYEDNTPGFRRAPYLFKDLVRNNPMHYLKKYSSSSYRSPTESQHQLSDQQRKETPDKDDSTYIFIVYVKETFM